MMNRIFNEKDKKDLFMVKSLLPYLAQHIEDSNNQQETANEVAGMFIYPYRTKDGIRIGSMNEPNVKWYFVSDSDKKTMSAGGYRIFAHEVLSPDDATHFKGVIGKFCDFHEYSDSVVIEDLIMRMSKETEYSDVWWTYAYDVFKLWNPEKFNVNLSAATDSIDSDGFLFIDGYCDDRIKKRLLEYRVFTDVVDEQSSKLFWDHMKTKEQKDKAVQLLKNMGVPHSFVMDGDEVNPNIYWFLERIQEDISFPASGKANIEKCSVCHTVCMDIIFNESPNAFDTMVSDEDYYGGIVLKNVLGQFVPLSWDLFYDSDTEDNTADEENEITRDVNPFFEKYRIDFKCYGEKRLDLMCYQVHDFSNVDDELDAYNVEWNGHPAEFYKWIWSYSKSSKVAEIALHSLSGRWSIEAISSEYNDFVIDILKTIELEDEDYSFAIHLNPESMFADSELWNQVDKDFEKIYAVIDGDVTSIDVTEFVSNIVAASQSDLTVKGEIVTDPIWQHVYLVDDDEDQFDSVYVKAYRIDDYEEALFLWPSEDTDSYVSALAAYVSAKYEIEVAIASAQAFDWKQEYMKLVKGIRSFISEKRDIKSADDIFGYIAEADDVETFGQEKVIWEKMLKQRDAIMQQTTGKFPVDLSNWRSFLLAKYHGRCQLCGGKIDMGAQDSYFWTFRMIKPSRNQLADMNSNMFCLCPSCHGEMNYGNYMGKDMSSVIEKAKMYADYIEKKINSGECKDHYRSLIQEVFEMNSVPEEDEEKLEGFHNPIVCDVVINGKKRYMAFSWEHFMKLAFIFSKLNDFPDENIVFEDTEIQKLIRPDISTNFNNGNHQPHSHSHGYTPWHGTEWVNGHYRTRNGRTEWVRGHYRTR